jgi:hypothetical protein
MESSEHVQIEGERVVISSGKVLIGDQFLLALQSSKEGQSGSGCLSVEFKNGTYPVLRNVEEKLIMLGEFDEDTAFDIGQIPVETGCILFCDEGTFFEKQTNEKYRTLFRSTKIEEVRAQQKQARDFLRTKGGAARYGFVSSPHRLDIRGSEGGLMLSFVSSR